MIPSKKWGGAPGAFEGVGDEPGFSSPVTF